jgi:hypothetical protein
MWEAHIVETLAVRPDKKSDYLILRSEQVGGFANVPSQVLTSKTANNTACWDGAHHSGQG